MGKFPPTGSHLSTWWDGMGIFGREAVFYSKLAPAFQKAVKARGIADIPFPLAPYADEKCIVMENLKRRGFAIRDPKLGLELPHME